MSDHADITSNGAHEGLKSIACVDTVHAYVELTKPEESTHANGHGYANGVVSNGEPVSILQAVGSVPPTAETSGANETNGINGANGTSEVHAYKISDDNLHNINNTEPSTEPNANNNLRIENAHMGPTSSELDTNNSIDMNVNNTAIDPNTNNSIEYTVNHSTEPNVTTTAQIESAHPGPSDYPGTSNGSSSNAAGPSLLDNHNGNSAANAMPSSSLNNSFGIAADDDGGGDVDEHGNIRPRKGKRVKERSYSRIVLQHKKNLIGETIYKGHQSWVLMLNIQTGIRNAVGKGLSRNRSTIIVPRNPLVMSPSQIAQSNLAQASDQIQPNASPVNSVQQPSPTPSQPATPKYPADGELGPSNFDNVNEFYASPRVLQFPSAGSSQTIPHQTGPFKFKDYSPHAFRFLRHRFGIDTADYMVSLCNTQKNGENALRELPTPGKSGSLFFFSHDMRFILKTIPKSEAKLLRKLLPAYVAHIADDENTLLPKFFGLHRVKPHRGRQVRFLVMNNVFQTRKKIHERYDLKGSTLGRAASEDEKKKDTVTYKDMDFRERHVKIQIGPQKRGALLEQLQRDSKFLALLNIMDYSLLIGIHHEDGDDDRSGPPSPLVLQKVKSVSSGEKRANDVFHSIFQTNDGGMRGVDEHGIATGKYYYMGIIDILMLYSIRKKIEHTYKTLRFKKGGEEISAISPPDYAIRFYEFVAATVT